MDIPAYLSSQFQINFDAQQRLALDAVHGAALLLAVPGGGKTTVLVSRVANMILNHEVAAHQILTVTYNKESALDMKARFEQLFGELIGATPTFSTIHSLCFSVVAEYARFRGQPMPALIEGNGSPISKIKLLKDIYQAVNEQYPSEETIQDLQRLIGYYINTMTKPTPKAEDNSDIENMDKLFSEYQSFKRKNQLMDFDDMLSYGYHALKKHPQILAQFSHKYHYINVDEAQDTSKLQHEIIKLLSGSHGNIFMVGDEDQSIYAFRGAFPDALMQFQTLYPHAQILKMEQNFRCPPHVIEGASRLIGHNKNRYTKNMYTTKTQQGKIVTTRLSGSDKQNEYLLNAIKSADETETIAILYRNNPSAISILDMLDRQKIPFYIKDHKSPLVNQMITQDILSVIRLHDEPFHMESLYRVYYKFNVFISQNMMKFAEAHRNEYESPFDAMTDFPTLDKLSTGKMMYLKHMIAKFGKIPPAKVIDHIIYDFGYHKFLEKCSQNGYLMEVYMQTVSSLRYIASHTKTIKEFVERIYAIDGIISAASQNRQSSSITLSTIHSAKGLEFDRVFIIDALEGILPSKMAIHLLGRKSEAMMEEETRLFYVAMTRSKGYLEIISSEYAETMSVSRFVSMLRSDLQADLFIEKQIEIGRNVSHKYFGTGRITGVDYHKNTCTVRFISAGIKVLSIEIFDHPATIRVVL